MTRGLVRLKLQDNFVIDAFDPGFRWADDRKVIDAVSFEGDVTRWLQRTPSFDVTEFRL